MNLLEHFITVLSLYLKARIRIRIKVTRGIQIRIRIEVTRRIRISNKVIQIRKTARTLEYQKLG
jgi:hypothetical protein